MIDKEIDGTTWMTTSQICKYLQFDRATISRFRGQGMPYITGPHEMRPTYRYNKTEVDQWLKTKKKG